MTNSTLETTAKSEPPSSPPAGDVADALLQTLRNCGNRDEMYRVALSALATHFDAPYAAIRVEKSAGCLEHELAASDSASSAWRRPAEALLLDSRYHRLAKARLYESDGASDVFAAIATPLSEATSGVVGSMVFFTRCADVKQVETLLRELKTLAALLGVMATTFRSGSQSASAGQPQLGAGLAKAAQYDNLHEFAFAIANNLAAKLNCDQVALGLVRNSRVEVLCISGFDDLFPRSPGAKMIQQVMAECHDAGCTICQQSGTAIADEHIATGHLLHKEWHRETGNSAVASIPLAIDGLCIAVISLRRPTNRPFNAAQLEKVSELASPLAPGLLLLEKAGKGVFRHILDTSGARLTNFFRTGSLARQAAAVVALVALGWVVFGKCEYVVSVPCHIRPAETRDIAMPFEGTLAANFVKPGDQVRAGDILARLDQRPLHAERDKLRAELQISQVNLIRAAADKDLSTAAQAQAQAEIVLSELSVVEDRLKRAEIRAPADGQILAGDLTARVGEVIPLGERLIEFAPRGQWQLALQIPEHAAPYINPGQTGYFATSARPGQASACRVERLKPSTEVTGGKNVFTAEASVDETPPEWVRAGMEGVARVHTLERPIWWVWLHRMIDTIRLQLWRV